MGGGGGGGGEDTLLAKEKHKQLSKVAPSAVHWRTLKTQENEIDKIYLFLMYHFFLSFGNNEHQHVSKTCF